MLGRRLVSRRVVNGFCVKTTRDAVDVGESNMDDDDVSLCDVELKGWVVLAVIVVVI